MKISVVAALQKKGEHAQMGPSRWSLGAPGMSSPPKHTSRSPRVLAIAAARKSS